jgi:hypothetical protein
MIEQYIIWSGFGCGQPHSETFKGDGMGGYTNDKYGVFPAGNGFPSYGFKKNGNGNGVGKDISPPQNWF